MLPSNRPAVARRKLLRSLIVALRRASRPGPRARAVLRALLAGVLTFLVVAWGLNTLVRALPLEPKAGILNPKLAYLEQHADELDTIFVGSSRVHFQIDPLVFDAEMARLGCHSRSFNMGVHALNTAEERHLLKRLAEIDAGRWKWIFIERKQLPARQLRALGSDRQYYFLSGITDLRLSLESIWTSNRGLRNNLIDTVHLLLAYAYVNIGGGQLSRLLPTPPGASRPEPRVRVDLSRRGFVPVELEIEPALRRRAAAMDRKALAERLALTRAHDGRFERLSEARAAHFAEQVAAARRVAPNVGLVIFPQAWSYWVDDILALEQAAREGRLGEVTVVNLGDPRRHPEIYVERLWYENDHVIGEGAVMLSTYLARELCPHVIAQHR
jgi:hypothetical protein